MPWKPKTHKPHGAGRAGSDRAYEERRSRDPALARARAIRSSARWQKFRRMFLARHPLCQDPLEVHKRSGSASAAVDVHHVIPLASRPDLALDPENCMAVRRPATRGSSDPRPRGPAQGRMTITEPQGCRQVDPGIFAPREPDTEVEPEGHTSGQAPAAMPERCCYTCRWAELDPYSMGTCHRQCPNALDPRYAEARWPEITGRDWCGDWRGRKRLASTTTPCVDADGG